MKRRDADVLLVSSTNQNGGGIGSLFLRDLMMTNPELSYKWYLESPFLTSGSSKRFGGLFFIFTSVLSKLAIWQKVRLSIFRRYISCRKIEALNDFVSENRFEYILITTSSPELILIGRRLAEKGLRLFVLVWDDPEYLIHNLKLKKTREADRIMHDFEMLVRNASAVSVISEGMQARYNKRYGIESEVITHGIDSKSSGHFLAPNLPVRIVYAGSLYSKKEWNALVETLEMSGGRIAGRPVELYFVGRFPRWGAVRPLRMVHIPPVSQSEALDILVNMDIGYLPYWIDSKHEVVTRTSFPGKMTAYAATGLDVFHHGPAYSTVTQFLSKFPFGVSCDSLKPYDILEKLECLVRRLDSEAFNEARNQAMDKRLSHKAMGASFQRFLNRGGSGGSS